MNLALRKPMKLAEFLEWEEGHPLRHEFDGVGPIAMTGRTWRHSTIQRNLAIAIGGPLRGKPCQFQGSDLKFQVANGNVRYTDSMIIGSPVAATAKIVYDPTIVFEVLSASTARTDRIVKAYEYQATPSVQRYVMIEQDGISATAYVRAGAIWTHEVLLADSILALPEIGIDLPLAELYEGLEFEAEHPSDIKVE